MTTEELFDQAESEVDYGRSWRFREDDAPNPLTIKVTGWSLDVAMPNGDLVDFVRGTDRNGESWSILVGGAVLKQALVEGRVDEWDEESQSFKTTGTLGRVQPGQVISVKYTGDKRSKAGYDYPTFRVSRVGQADPQVAAETAAVTETPAEAPAAAPAEAPAQDVAKDDIPF